MEVSHPKNIRGYDDIIATAPAAYTVEIKSASTRLRGTFKTNVQQHTVLFLGEPILQETKELRRLNLSPSDFAHHSATLDVLFTNQAHKATLAELKLATETLRLKNEEIRANEQKLSSEINAKTEYLRKEIERRKIAEERLVSYAQNLEKEVLARTFELAGASATLDVLEVGIYIFSASDLSISYTNHGASLITGLPKEELKLYKFSELFEKVHRPKIYALCEALGRETKSTNFIGTLLHKSKPPLSVSITLQAVDTFQNKKSCIAVVKDISYQIAQEKAERRSQRLESIGNLAGGLAHDINNALTPMTMIIANLQARHPEDMEILNTLEQCAFRTANIVRQLLTFAKGSEGEKTQLRTEKMIQEVVEFIGAAFPKNIQVNTKIQPPHTHILGDPTQVHQILMNLCVNARDAMPEGGSITILAALTEVDETYLSSIGNGIVSANCKPGKFVRISVIDTGTGIPADIIDNIFDPFFTTKPVDKGTGLGLSTVAGIVKGHDGFLKVYSHARSGTTFDIFLPAVTNNPRSETSTPFKKHVIHLNGAERKILYVDDEMVLRTAAEVVLHSLNFKPILASDGAEGLIKLAQIGREISCIVTDIAMPNMDGLTFVKAVRQIFHNIPIIAASGRFEDSVIEELKQYEVSLFLPKPFNEHELISALSEALGTLN